MKKSKYEMYSNFEPSQFYDMTSDFGKKSEYDMYSDQESKCGEHHIHVGPLVIEFCQHEDGKQHVCVYIEESGEMIAETEISDHDINSHMSVIKEGIDDIHKAYMHYDNNKNLEKRCWEGYEPTPGKKPYEKGSCRPIKKADKPFHGYNPKKHSRTGGLSDSYRKKVNREEGSNLKRPVTGKVKPGSKAAKRRKSFCARMSGVSGPTSKEGKLTPKGAALKRWKCHKSEQLDKSEQLKNFMAKVDQKRQLEHYSKTPGLKNIDPKYIGTGVPARGQETKQTAHPHSFYYKPEAPTEELVTRGATHKYMVDLPEDAKIYDISTDPEGFAKQVRDQNNGAFNMDMMHEKMKNSGYHGFEMSQHPVESMRGVVGLYHSMPVSESIELWRK